MPSASPRTNSVDPPPMSQTRYGGGTASTPCSSRVAPANDRAASSAPLATSGATPSRAVTPSTNNALFSASRVALVATIRTRSAPSRRISPA